MPGDLAVVDASALAAIVFNEPQAASAAAKLGGSELAAPTLLPYEMASVCRKKLLRHPAQREALLGAHSSWPRLAIRLVTVDSQEVLLVADRIGITTYDASYLWLAEALGVRLVTLDLPLDKLWRSRSRRARHAR